MCIFSAAACASSSTSINQQNYSLQATLLYFSHEFDLVYHSTILCAFAKRLPEKLMGLEAVTFVMNIH